MTILGLHLTGPDTGLIWCETEVFVGGKMAGHCNKLSVNPTIGAVAIGGGVSDILAGAERLFRDGCQFEELIEIIPAALRKSERQFEPNADSQQATFAMIGPLKGTKRLTAVVFDMPYYMPRHVRTFTLPHHEALQSLHPITLDDITGLAQEQVFTIRDHLPTSRGGLLIGATISLQGVVTRRVMDMRDLPLKESRPPITGIPAAGPRKGTAS